jgi:hypothetical protein
VANFRYLGTTTNQNLIQEEIKKRLNSDNAWYHSVQNLLSSRLLSKNIKIRIYMLLSRRQNIGQNHNIKIADSCFDNVAQFKYLGTTITNQNLIQEEIKKRLNSGNACYPSAQNLFSSQLLSKNIKIRIYKSISLPVVLHGCETLSLMLMEEHRLRMFENRFLRRIFGPKRDEVMGDWRKLHNEELHKVDEMGRTCSTNGGEEECISDIGGEARRKETN